MKKVVIVESPNKIKSINHYLGNDYKVIATVGHIRDITMRGVNGYGVESIETWEPKWEHGKKHKAIIDGIIAECKDADEIFIASDPDREGEAIAWHVKEVLKLKDEDVNRIDFYEINKNSVLEQIKKPRKIDMDMVNSQLARRIVDRIIGFDISKLLKKTIHSESAGRVQSIVLKLINDREKEIKKFVAKHTWSIDIELENNAAANLRKINDKKLDKENFKFMDEGTSPDFIDPKEAKKIADDIGDSLKVYLIDPPSFQINRPHLPYKTSTLQQDAANKLNYSSTKTMSCAQVLFEGINIDGDHRGVITYPRTDSDRMSDSFIKELQDYILKNYGKEYLGSYDQQKILDAKKKKEVVKIQDAHEAIRVSDIHLTPAKIKPFLKLEEYKLYNLIWLRTVASLMSPKKIQKDTLRLISKDKYKFYAFTNKIVFDGYGKIYAHYNDIDDAQHELSKKINFKNVKVGDTIKIKTKEVKEHIESAPPRYSDARIVKTMEENGIGRPSTYASMISVNVKRGYVAKDVGRSYIPTHKGEATVEFLEKYFKEIFNIEFTSLVENHLDLIEKGKLTKNQAINEFYKEFVKAIKDEKRLKAMQNEKVTTFGPCPKCGQGELIERTGRFGHFLGCNKYNREDKSSCSYIGKMNNPNAIPPKLLDRKCPTCGSQLIERTNRRKQQFVGCTAFPKCKFIENIEKPKKEEAKAAE